MTAQTADVVYANDTETVDRIKSCVLQILGVDCHVEPDKFRIDGWVATINIFRHDPYSMWTTLRRRVQSCVFPEGDGFVYLSDARNYLESSGKDSNMERYAQYFGFDLDELDTDIGSDDE